MHKSRRDSRWTTLEEAIDISKLTFDSEIVLLDCITLWLMNIYDKFKYEKEESIQFARNEWDRFIKKDITVYVVSNEVGMGIIPIEKSGRDFAELQGFINQHIAKTAETVTFMVSGLPMKVK